MNPKHVDGRTVNTALPRWIEWAMDLECMRNWWIGALLALFTFGYYGMAKAADFINRICWPNMSEDSSILRSMLFGGGYAVLALFLLFLPVILSRRAERSLRQIYKTETGEKFVADESKVCRALSAIVRDEVEPSRKIARFTRARRAAELLYVRGLSTDMDTYVNRHNCPRDMPASLDHRLN